MNFSFGQQRQARERRGFGRAARKWTTAAAAATAVVLGLTSCVQVEVPGLQEEAAAQQSAAAQGASPELQPYYLQSLSWKPCGTGSQCTQVKVPVDYNDPGGDTASISMIKMPATGKSKGPLLVNPGGPGGSGYDFVANSADAVLSATMRENYDVIGFDPRGVKRSTPVTCLSDQDRDAERERYFDTDTEAGVRAMADAVRKSNQQCEANTGPILAHVDTVSAARDMDVIRSVLGQEKLNYLGFSYGTFLGSTFAQLFPERVGRFVLDGALDSSLTNSQVAIGQAKGFERATREFVKWCLDSSSCPLQGPEDNAMKQIQTLISDYRQQPQRANDGRLVTEATLVSGFILPLYSNENWPLLAQALDPALDGDPTAMLNLADFGADRGADGKYTSNSSYAFTAINCLDYKMDSSMAAMLKEKEELIKASPTIGHSMAFGGISCDGLDAKATRTPAPVKYQGKQPIVVIGTVGDPATPYQWAVNLRQQIGNASLVTWEGEGHTAYGRGGSCVTSAVDDYFLHNTLPKDGLRCPK